MNIYAVMFLCLSDVCDKIIYINLTSFFDDRFANEPRILKYIKIAATLRDKTVRDVAMRCRWIMVSSRGCYYY